MRCYSHEALSDENQWCMQEESGKEWENWAVFCTPLSSSAELAQLVNAPYCWYYVIERNVEGSKPTADSDISVDMYSQQGSLWGLVNSHNIQQR